MSFAALIVAGAGCLGPAAIPCNPDGGPPVCEGRTPVCDEFSRICVAPQCRFNSECRVTDIARPNAVCTRDNSDNCNVDAGDFCCNLDETCLPGAGQVDQCVVTIDADTNCANFENLERTLVENNSTGQAFCGDRDVFCRDSKCVGGVFDLLDAGP